MNSETSPAQWKDLIDESVHTSDDTDIGDIEAVSKSFVVVKRGFINIHYYYIPMTRIEGWDGHVLWLNVSEELVKKKYERDKPPDPNYFYVKDFPYYGVLYSPLPLIPSRFIAPSYANIAKLEESAPRAFLCNLCDQVFTSEHELNLHTISEAH
ncbi:MAG TPA: hypothetical protein VE548_05510 [Nitrososphaeraceae archaeon]|jgi:hypothetical protein|nr:hypothetical protein [Nitrososphaeraceae archaeon]